MRVEKERKEQEEGNNDMKSELLTTFKVGYDGMWTDVTTIQQDLSNLIDDKFSLCKSNYVISVAKHAIGLSDQKQSCWHCFQNKTDRKSFSTERAAAIRFPFWSWSRLAKWLSVEQLESMGLPRPEKYTTSLFLEEVLEVRSRLSLCLFNLA